MFNSKSQELTMSLVIAFRKMISSGKLMPGDRMEPERKLAARFGVNRATLRQALKVLVAVGVVRQRVGDGTYVTADAVRILEPQPPSGKIDATPESLRNRVSSGRRDSRRPARPSHPRS
jgi:GntR family transcriptional repressor for pyruvate dehydrogenase complex